MKYKLHSRGEGVIIVTLNSDFILYSQYSNSMKNIHYKKIDIDNIITVDMSESNLSGIYQIIVTCKGEDVLYLEFDSKNKADDFGNELLKRWTYE